MCCQLANDNIYGHCHSLDLRLFPVSRVWTTTSIPINTTQQTHSNVFVLNPDAIINWNAIKFTDFAKSSNMLKSETILSSDLSLAGSLRPFAEPVPAVPDVALGPCLGQSRVLVVVLNWWRNFGIVRSGNKIYLTIAWYMSNQVKSCQPCWCQM